MLQRFRQDRSSKDMEKSTRVVVMGASPKPNRYSFKAIQMLQHHGHEPVPVNPAYDEVLGLKCYRRIGDVPQPIDTVTIYLGQARSNPLIEEITNAGVRRIILNPGAENEQLSNAAAKKGIEVVEGCTLVMLTIGSF